MRLYLSDVCTLLHAPKLSKAKRRCEVIGPVAHTHTAAAAPQLLPFPLPSTASLQIPISCDALFVSPLFVLLLLLERTVAAFFFCYFAFFLMSSPPSPSPSRPFAPFLFFSFLLVAVAAIGIVSGQPRTMRAWLRFFLCLCMSVLSKTNKSKRKKKRCQTLLFFFRTRH